ALISGALRGNLGTENPCVPGSIPGGTAANAIKCLQIKYFQAFFVCGGRYREQLRWVKLVKHNIYFVYFTYSVLTF
ncbi:MAG: hypothetical protein ACHQRM_18260, partial [Bacteroidia bacterium]